MFCAIGFEYKQINVVLSWILLVEAGLGRDLILITYIDNSSVLLLVKYI